MNDYIFAGTVLIIIIVAIMVNIHEHKKQIVKKSSTKYQNILEYEKTIKLKNAKKEYRYTIQKKTRRQVENINSFYELQYLVFWDETIRWLAADLVENRKTLVKFMDFCNSVNETSINTITNSGLSIDKYRSIEGRLVNELKKPFLEEPVIYITFTYTTPKTMKTTWVRYRYSVDDIINVIVDADERGKKAIRAQVERSKMSQSLRYDVLKRDNFRCVICGRSAEDGITLHVDHIIPVSKGGKTEPGNLRTLCEDCNLGKKAKYDPKGLN